MTAHGKGKCAFFVIAYLRCNCPTQLDVKEHSVVFGVHQTFGPIRCPGMVSKPYRIVVTEYGKSDPTLQDSTKHMISGDVIHVKRFRRSFGTPGAHNEYFRFYTSRSRVNNYTSHLHADLQEVLSKLMVVVLRLGIGYFAKSVWLTEPVPRYRTPQERRYAQTNRKLGRSNGSISSIHSKQTPLSAESRATG